MKINNDEKENIERVENVAPLKNLCENNCIPDLDWVTNFNNNNECFDINNLFNHLDFTSWNLNALDLNIDCNYDEPKSIEDYEENPELSNNLFLNQSQQILLNNDSGDIMLNPGSFENFELINNTDCIINNYDCDDQLKINKRIQDDVNNSFQIKRSLSSEDLLAGFLKNNHSKVLKRCNGSNESYKIKMKSPKLKNPDLLKDLLLKRNNQIYKCQ